MHPLYLHLKRSIGCVGSISAGAYEDRTNTGHHVLSPYLPFDPHQEKPRLGCIHSAEKIMLTEALTISFAACTTVPASSSAMGVSTPFANISPTLFE